MLLGSFLGHRLNDRVSLREVDDVILVTSLIAPGPACGDPFMTSEETCTMCTLKDLLNGVWSVSRTCQEVELGVSFFGYTPMC